jgi:hypothetical protein
LRIGVVIPALKGAAATGGGVREMPHDLAYENIILVS